MRAKTTSTQEKDEAEEGRDPDPRRDLRDQVRKKNDSAGIAVKVGRLVEFPWHRADEAFQHPDRDGQVEQAMYQSDPTGEFTRPNWLNRMKIGSDSTTGGVTRKTKIISRKCRSPVKR